MIHPHQVVGQALDQGQGCAAHGGDDIAPRRGSRCCAGTVTREDGAFLGRPVAVGRERPGDGRDRTRRVLFGPLQRLARLQQRWLAHALPLDVQGEALCEAAGIVRTLSSGQRQGLPRGFHRIRHVGLFANARRKASLATLRDLLLTQQPVAPDTSAAPVATAACPAPATFVCPCCGAPMRILDSFGRGQPIRAPPSARGAP
jgi:hypothetical protein